MKTEPNPNPAELAALACSPALAGLIAQLEAAAKKADRDGHMYSTEWLKDRMWGKSAAFRESANMARQCQESLEVSDRP